MATWRALSLETLSVGVRYVNLPVSGSGFRRQVRDARRILAQTRLVTRDDLL